MQHLIPWGLLLVPPPRPPCVMRGVCWALCSTCPLAHLRQGWLAASSHAAFWTNASCTPVHSQLHPVPFEQHSIPGRVLNHCKPCCPNAPRASSPRAAKTSCSPRSALAAATPGTSAPPPAWPSWPPTRSTESGRSTTWRRTPGATTTSRRTAASGSSEPPPAGFRSKGRSVV
jgi:hypothetical protein